MLDEADELTIAQEHLEHDLTGQVSFNQVDFSYTADNPLIRNFNLEVKPGEMVAIVGPTGAGKTTLINLLMRFYDVNEGSITVDGQDIRQLSRQAIGVSLVWCCRTLGSLRAAFRKTCALVI